jgi:hypothetical protein
LLSLEGIDERGRLLRIEPHWIHYVEPWATGDMPDRESGSMIAFDRERAIRDRRDDEREGRQLHSVPPSRIRDLEVDCTQLASLWGREPYVPDVPRKPTPREDLRAAIEKVQQELGEPGKSLKAPWKTFYDRVRAICEISELPPPRGYGDKSIYRAVKAIRAEQAKSDNRTCPTCRNAPPVTASDISLRTIAARSSEASNA